MNKGVEKEIRIPTRWLRRVVFGLIVIISTLFLIFLVYQLTSFIRNRTAADSPFEHYTAEREFLTNYAHDKKNGGFYVWVERDGTVADKRKYSLFQANILLWFGGIQTQYPDPINLAMIEDAADYLVDYLYKGNGEWYEYDTLNHRTRQEFFWNPRSESYISFALLQAYRFLGNERYLEVATETNQAQRDKSINGKIYAEFDASLDIGVRFPEHMGHMEEYRITGNQEALDFVRLFDDQQRGFFGKEVIDENIGLFYYHGMAVIDQLLYGMLDENFLAYNDASIGRNVYWSMPHSDTHPYNPEIPGESSDHGRDYYDKRLAMDLIEWTVRGASLYQEDASDIWDEVKRFWDKSAPYGFLVNTIDGRKTCFTIGVSQYLMDLLAPEVRSYQNDSKGLFNHQVSITFEDKDYMWNSIPMRGIGTSPDMIKAKIPFGAMYGSITIDTDTCENCTTYTFNYFSFFPQKIQVAARDYLGNTEFHKLDNPFRPFATFKDINIQSIYYYIFLSIFSIVAMSVIYLVVFFIILRSTEDRRLKRLKQKTGKENMLTNSKK